MPEIDLTDIKGHPPKLSGSDVTHQLTLWTIMDETSLGAVETWNNGVSLEISQTF
jgi:hypothetical protein